MAVEYVKELWPGRGAADDIEKRTKLRHVYEVRTTAATDDATVAGGTSLLPRLGDPHPNYPAAYVVGVIPDQLDDDPTLWHVTIEYSSELPNRSATSGNGVALGPGPESQGLDANGEPTNNAAPTDRAVNPLSRPAVWRRHLVEVEEPFEFDANGDPVVNSAGLPFDPPIITKYRYIVLTIVKNVSGVSNQTILDYIDHTNDAVWKGIAIGKALVVQFETASDFENDFPFTQVTLGIAVTNKSWGWKRRVIDRGFYELVDLGGGAQAFERIRDDVTGLTRTEPSLLDGAGALLAVGDPAVELDFDEFSTANFTTLMSLLGIG